MILISAAYIYDYKENDKYIYEGTIFQNKSDEPDRYSKMYNDDEISPYLNVTFNIYLSKFGAFDERSSKFLEVDHFDCYKNQIYTLKKKINSLEISLFYKCGEDKNCSSLKDYLYTQGRWLGEFYEIYPKYKINHQERPPIELQKDEYPLYNHGYPLQVSETQIGHDSFEWETIKYQDQKILA